MNYTQVTDWLFSRVANYQKVGGSAYKPGLEIIQILLDHFGNPHHSFKSVHIAGTNGKGSVAHILSSALQENGLKVGLFSSPHLKDFRERIKINGQVASQEFVIRFVDEFRKSNLEVDPSFFELTTAMAFKAFAEEKVDIAIVETGLGGRLDATNVVVPEVSVITNIGMEHTEYLGDTLAKIATEKAGIMKEGVPFVIGEILSETKTIFEQFAEDLGCQINFIEDDIIDSDLLGNYQQKNLNIAQKVLEILGSAGLSIDEEKSFSGFKKVRENTGFIGRFQKLQEHPLIIADAAHNTSGIEMLMRELSNFSFDRLHIVFGASKEKNFKEMLSYFPDAAIVYLTTFRSERSASKEQLKSVSTNLSREVEIFSDSREAFSAAKKSAAEKDLILICGSFFLLEEIL